MSLKTTNHLTKGQLDHNSLINLSNTLVNITMKMYNL